MSDPDPLAAWYCPATLPLPSGSVYPDPHWPDDYAARGFAQRSTCKRCGQAIVCDRGWRLA